MTPFNNENKTPSFELKTEDGVVLTYLNRDIVYLVIPKNSWFTANIRLASQKICEMLDKKKNDFKYFSSKENRDIYILNNRPLLSLNDLKNNHILIGPGDWKDLLKIAKEKLIK